MRNWQRRMVVWLGLALLLIPIGIVDAVPQTEPQAEKLLEVANGLMPEVARIRGLQPKGAVDKGIKSRAEISQFISQEIERHQEKDQLRTEGVFLQKLGLIPADMDYVAFTLKLLTEQVGGYYDPEKKAFYVAGWLPVEEQKPAMVHELTHALQDQYFDLNGIMDRDRKAKNEDRTLAHQALAEGDATAVMLDYMLRPLGKSFLDLPNLAVFMRSQMELMNDQFEVLKTAPTFLKETLVFPYSYGTAFLQQICANGAGWAAVDKIYHDLPASTEQIMHPEKYSVARDNPRQVELDDPSSRLGKGWKIRYRTVLGEFFLYELLKSQLPEDVAQRASAGWGGDQMILLTEDESSNSAVFMNSVWDDMESADRFYAAMSDWIAKRYPQGQRSGETENGLSVVSAGEYSSLGRSGTTVRLIVGLPEPLAGKVDSKPGK